MGRDRSATEMIGIIGYFNSHARVGRDKAQLAKAYDLLISTHTPAWGVTSSTYPSLTFSQISTHTPAWGVTQMTFDMEQEV